MIQNDNYGIMGALDLIPTYQKPIFGGVAVLEIGIDTLRRECPIFNHWIERLENAVTEGVHT
jgi:hypothetical protein